MYNASFFRKKKENPIVTEPHSFTARQLLPSPGDELFAEHQNLRCLVTEEVTDVRPDKYDIFPSFLAPIKLHPEISLALQPISAQLIASSTVPLTKLPAYRNNPNADWTSDDWIGVVKPGKVSKSRSRKVTSTTNSETNSSSTSHLKTLLRHPSSIFGAIPCDVPYASLLDFDDVPIIISAQMVSKFDSEMESKLSALGHRSDWNPKRFILSMYGYVGYNASPSNAEILARMLLKQHDLVLANGYRGNSEDGALIQMRFPGLVGRAFKDNGIIELPVYRRFVTKRGQFFDGTHIRVSPLDAEVMVAF